MIDQHHADSTVSVTVVGFGAMGVPMATRLANSGLTVHVVDPSAEARARADDLGLDAFTVVNESPTCDLVLVLVATGQQLLDAATAATTGRSVRGETWIVSSTVGPNAVRDAAKILRSGGAAVIDAPVTGGVPGAENGTLRFLAAASKAEIDSASKLFAPLGSVVVVGDQVGDGQATKLVNQLCSSVHLAAAAEAVALASRLGLDPSRTVEVISGGSGASWFFDERGPRMARVGDSPDVLTRLAILAKDNSLVEVEADAHQAYVPLLKAAKRQYERAAELGLLEEDDSQLIHAYFD
ncbi:NAD(P)-dependent oxidoreductase [Mycolicibacterium sp. P9-64]|uniref:NAD(P)-dependent oxidoreductase n=1 Tax=Mycolicibacterium sp. P9-64 TaxID=2024612 RepID=UPI0011EE0285|nr:NAD(P)-dependent oxidoreductase [Mycolicibacterium sp. P9-64]KAA0086680.1 NAD(P)-dependent oxidoreductase [Mycolicibacterium sp. P9-64]